MYNVRVGVVLVGYGREENFGWVIGGGGVGGGWWVEMLLYLICFK